MSQPTSNSLPSHMYRAYSPGEGDQGAYGVESAELVGEMTMIGVRLLGGVGGLLSGMTGEVDSEMTSLLSSTLMRSLIGIGCCSMGATICGCWLGGTSLLAVGFMISVRVIGCVGLLSLCLVFCIVSTRAAVKRALPMPMKAPKSTSVTVSVMRVPVMRLVTGTHETEHSLACTH